jgi:hypothetical protein
MAVLFVNMPKPYKVNTRKQVKPYIHIYFFCQEHKEKRSSTFAEQWYFLSFEGPFGFASLLLVLEISDHTSSKLLYDGEFKKLKKKKKIKEKRNYFSYSCGGSVDCSVNGSRAPKKSKE